LNPYLPIKIVGIDKFAPKEVDEKNRPKLICMVGNIFGKKKCKGVVEEIDPQLLISNLEL
jgi:hypothetical protein